MPDRKLHRRAFLRLAGGSAAAAALARVGLSAAPKAPAKAGRPNIVVIVADDLGWGDVGYHAGKIATPNIDRLAAEGVRLERFYVCPVCSPTRAGLMTGRYPIRFGLMRCVVPPWSRYGLPPGEQTLAEMLARAGYVRRGVVGKWHLGHADRKYHALNQGFTHFYGHYNGAIDYFTHVREGQLDWHRGFETCRDAGYSTGLLAAEAERFVRQSPADKPFFLYVPFNAPHSPFQAEDADLRKYGHLAGRRRTYAAMVHAMDRGIGRILKALDDRGLAEDTLVLFFSDNGGVAGVADNRPLRGAKATVYEGGIRVPAVIRWPRGALRGGRAVDARMGYVDVYPTLKRVVGLDLPDPNPLDGRDMLDVIRGRAEAQERDWFSFLAMNDRAEKIAVTTDTWKLVVHGAGVLDRRPGAKRRVELFRIARDPHEKTDLADRHPDVVQGLLAKLRTFRAMKIDGVRAYAAGRKGFRAPENWTIPK